jgi:hypothetical protein
LQRFAWQSLQEVTMVKADFWLATSALLLAACGGSSGLSLDGGAGGSSGCNLANLVATCQPSGTCTEQLTSSTAATVCYSNGVKMSISMTTSTSGAPSMAISVKNNSAACYSMAMSETSSGDMTMTFKNASGTTVATLVGGTTGETVTCPGASPSAIDSSCSTQAATAGSLAGSSSTTNCPQGTCAY